MKEDSIKSFRTAFRSFLREENLTDKFQKKKVITNWESIMGKTIAQRTEKVFFKEQTLFLKLSSATLKHELYTNRELVLQRVNEQLGKDFITEIRFI